MEYYTTIRNVKRELESKSKITELQAITASIKKWRLVVEAWKELKSKDTSELHGLGCGYCVLYITNCSKCPILSTICKGIYGAQKGAENTLKKLITRKKRLQTRNRNKRR